MTLYEAGEQVRVKVVEIHGGLRVRQQLRELGLQAGDAVVVLHRAPFGGAMAVRSQGTMIALGRRLAERVQVEPVK